MEQSAKFENLSQHPEWEYYQAWVDKARKAYLAKALSHENRDSHISLARALEGYDAVNNILEKFNGAITAGAKARRDLAESNGKSEIA